MYEVVIPLDVVDFTDLNDMVEQACRLSGKNAEVKRQLVILTDDVHLSMMFDSFRESLTAKNGRKAMSSKQSSVKKPSGKQPSVIGGSSRRIVETGEIYSLVELKKKIKAGEVRDGEVVENKHGERFVVVGGELIKEPQS